MPTGPGALPIRRALLAAVASLAFVPCAQAASVPPELRFQTLSNGRVSVHYHLGLEPMAREAVTLATEILAEHESRYRQSVGRVQIVLVDAEDDPNGFATPLPYPLVSIRAVAPHGRDGFGNHEGWLRLALTHELAHVVHLEQAHGLWRAGRKLFGRAPYLFPNSLAMTWMIEGLATHEETRLTAFGRGRSADSRMVLRMAALEGRFPSEDQAIYALETWPAGNTPYLFGQAFLQGLETRAPDTLPRLAAQHSAQIVPYLDGRTLEKVTGSGLHTQWQRFADESREDAAREAARLRAAGLTVAHALTSRGVRQGGARFSPDGASIAYTSGTLTRFPEIRLVRPDGQGDRRLVLRNGGTGLAWTPDGRGLVYEELQVRRTHTLRYDLSLVETGSGRVRRLTRGLRAYDPDVSGDGSRIVFARKLGDRSELCTVRIDGSALETLTSSAPGVEWSGPRFDPRGERVVASRLLPGGWLDLVLLDLRTRQVESLTHDRASDLEPTWTPDGEAIVFRSDRDGVSNLHAIRLADRAVLRLTNVLGGASEPAVSPDGRWVAFSSYSSRGYDVALAALDLASAPEAAPFVDVLPPPRPDPQPFSGSARPYRPLTSVLPRFWSPWLEGDEDESRVGIASGGSDPLFRHVWALNGTYGTESRRGNVAGFYMYDRFRTSLVASGQDTTEVVEEGTLVRTRQLDIRLDLPLRRTLRSQQTVSLAYRREREDGDLGAANRGGIEAAWTLSSAKTYPLAISPSDGGRVSLAWLHEAEALGADRSLEKLTADLRYYERGLCERDVVAVRLAGGTTIGAEDVPDTFAVGGYRDSGLLDVRGTNESVLRGYEDDAFRGRRFVAGSVEYRFPLASPQRGWRSLPVFLRHLRGSVFVDAAHAWGGLDAPEFRWRDVKTAAGGSLGFDTALGFTLPLSAEVSLARGLSRGGETRVSFRLGLAF